jgi:cell division protein FtsI/penicillin-binding protein 2
MDRRRHAPWLIAACLALFAVLALPWPGTASGESPAEAGGEAPQARVDAAPPAAPGSPAVVPEEMAGLGEMEFDSEAERYVAALDGGRAVLTIVPSLQAQLTRVLSDHRVPWGATVLIEPRTGRVLAMAEYARRPGEARGLALKAVAPAASVFKIVTSAALLERGVEPESEICYHGGKHRIAPGNLADDPRRDRRCMTLAAALGHSANVVFAKLADRGLSADLLRTEAGRFLFNAPIPFARPVEVSRAEIPEDPFALATTAAGFGPVRLSPLHGALLAAIVANGGVFVPPEIVERVDGAEMPARQAAHRAVDERVAGALAAMMRTTVTEGTARKLFRDRRSGSALRDVAVAGKTGSLAERNPYRDYSWFVGFAPADNPQVAVATVVANETLWRVKAPYVAREALRAYFADQAGRTQAALQRGTRTAAR